MKKRILVVDDDPDLLDNVLELLELEDYDAVGASHGKAGLAEALRTPPDLVVCDIGMPIMDGFEVLAALRDYPDTADVPFVFLTARASRADMRRGMTLGADDYLTKPFTRAELLEAVETRLQRHSGRSEDSAPPAQDAATGPVVAAPAMQQLYAQARQAARSDLPILLLGETGVGKDVLAHEIHKASARSSSPFLPLNCGALAESLLDSELFGHEKGAFTGASTRRAGLFESATGGTVFLDEIGDLPLATQVRLLRVLEDRKVRRVGGRSQIDVDVRIVSATNKDLEALSKTGAFRVDLFYRVGVMVLRVPPLRERLADIEPLARRFALAMARRMGWSTKPVLSADTLAILEGWNWPGNVRELRNVMDRSVALSAGGELRPEHLPPKMLRTPGPIAGHDEAPVPEGGTLEEQRHALEKQAIVNALRDHSGNQTRAAKALGISRRTLINRLDAYGLPRPRK